MAIHRNRSPLLVLASALLVSLGAAATALAANPIVTENLRPGVSDWVIPIHDKVDHTDWVATDVSAAQIEGYASLTSVDQGDTIEFFVNTSESAYEMLFYRIGWYGGRGAREITRVDRPGFRQPPCTQDPATRMIECSWAEPYSLTIPRDWLSGVYLVKLTGLDSGKQNYIIFVVREDDRPSDFLFLSAVNTYSAYNVWGGSSLYGGFRGKATTVSFDRPYAHWVQAATGVGDFFAWELNMVRWLEREGYDVSYATNVDAHANPATLFSRGVLLSVGHDEYWSYEMRRHAENARDRCVSLGFFAGNSVYWQVRYGRSPTSGRPDRTILVYKDDPLRDDPLATDGILANDHLIAGLFRMPRPGMPAGNPEDALLGVAHAFFPVEDDVLIERPAHPLMARVTTRRIPRLVGYEADRMFGNAPLGTERLAHSPITPLAGGDYDCDEAAGTCYSDMTLYQAPSLARVFATGTIQWAWGLDDFRVPGATAPRGYVDENARTLTRNALQALKGSGCDPEPDVEMGPPIVADFGISVADAQGTGTIDILRCLRNDTCLITSRGIGDRYPTVLLYGADEMHQSAASLQGLPQPPDHRLIGPQWAMRANDLQHSGDVWVVLGYRDLKVPRPLEDSLELLYLEQGKEGPRWEVARATLDVEADGILAQLPRMTAVALGVRKRPSDLQRP